MTSEASYIRRVERKKPPSACKDATATRFWHFLEATADRLRQVTADVEIRVQIL